MLIETFLKSDLYILDELKPENWSNIHTPYKIYISKPFCFPVKVLWYSASSCETARRYSARDLGLSQSDLFVNNFHPEQDR